MISQYSFTLLNAERISDWRAANWFMFHRRLSRPYYLQSQGALTASNRKHWSRTGQSSSGGSIWCLFFCVIKSEWRALLKLNKDPWPLVHKCSHTHGTIKALSSEGSWKRIWLEFKTVGNQDEKKKKKKSPIRVRDHPSDKEGDL